MKYPGKIITKTCLDKYSGLTRAQMEQMPGEYKSLFFDLCVEKTNAMKWAFESDPVTAEVGVLYSDCDICFMGPLLEIPADATVAVSHHEIKPEDEARYGKYNGGLVWAKTISSIHAWTAACRTSRWDDQAAIEDMAAVDPGHLYQIPRTENYGWWRLWQGVRPVNELLAEWRMKTGSNNSGIMINNRALGSIHTHFGEVRDRATLEYNRWVLGWLERLTMHPPAQRLLLFIHSIHPWMQLD